jgi:hypothetical protein
MQFGERMKMILLRISYFVIIYQMIKLRLKKFIRKIQVKVHFLHFLKELDYPRSIV